MVFKAGDAGLWYRKESPESAESKKKNKSRDSKIPASKTGQDSEPTTQNNGTCAKKVSYIRAFYKKI